MISNSYLIRQSFKSIVLNRALSCLHGGSLKHYTHSPFKTFIGKIILMKNIGGQLSSHVSWFAGNTNWKEHFESPIHSYCIKDELYILCQLKIAVLCRATNTYHWTAYFKLSENTIDVWLHGRLKGELQT